MKALLALIMMGATLPLLPALDLETALSEAMGANQGLQAERLHLGALERSKASALNNLYPEISAGAGWQQWNDASSQQRVVLVPNVPGGTAVPYTPNSESLGLFFKAQLTLSLASFAAIDRARAEFDAGRIKLHSYQATLQYEVKATFYRILFLQKSLELSRSQVETAQARLNQIDAAFRGGSAPELSLLQARIGFESRKTDVRAAEYALSQARYGLCLLIGRTPDKNLVLEGALEPPVPSPAADSKQLVAHYAESRGSIGGLAAQKEFLGIQATQVAGLIVPQVVLAWSTDPGVNDPWSKNLGDSAVWKQTNGALSVQVQWKLDSLLPGSQFWTSNANIADQKAALQKNLEQARIATTLRVQGILERIEQARLSLPGLDANAKDATKAAKLAQSAFVAGVRTLVETQDADVQARGADLGFLAEKLNLQLSLLELEQVLETPLEDIYELR